MPGEKKNARVCIAAPRNFEAYNGGLGEMRPDVQSCTTLILRPTTECLAKCALVCIAATRQS
jgi:hypothetical protein